MQKKKIHGFDGACSPKNGGDYRGMQTFSLGVFEILKTNDGLRTKRGKVKVRVRGHTSDPDRAYKVAKIIAEQLDAGTYQGPKSIKSWMYAT